ncbi:MAG: MoaD/ThiS family protein [Sphingomicrobium sp.]|jgi:molybdopterin converting factor small subunit
MIESPAARHLDLWQTMAKAVDLEPPRRETNAAKEVGLRILLYGRLADAIDREVELDAAEGSSIANLWNRLSTSRPSAATHLQRPRAVIGDRLVGDEHVVVVPERVEFLPPVSGG